jgi:hypothetical protein
VNFGEYRVIGKRNYRGHEPGTTFEARLDRGAEARAIARGDIQLLRLITPSLQEGTVTLPDGWPPPKQVAASDNHEAPEGAFSMDQGG